MYSPIALFVYCRLAHTKQVVDSLASNALAKESDLFIFSDAARTESVEKDVSQVREYIRTIQGFKNLTIIEREVNWGVDDSIIDGVTMLSEQFGTVIVVEDDLIVSSCFLQYMNDALERYRYSHRVMQIVGHMFPIEGEPCDGASFMSFSMPWGWATWKRAWDLFAPDVSDWRERIKARHIRSSFDLNGSFTFSNQLEDYLDGRSKAWDIRWYIALFDRDGLALFPNCSLVHNIGFDGTGEHCPTSDLPGSNISYVPVVDFPKVEVSLRAQRKVENYLRRSMNRTVWRYFRYVLLRRSRKWLLNKVRS